MVPDPMRLECWRGDELEIVSPDYFRHAALARRCSILRRRRHSSPQKSAFGRFVIGRTGLL